MIRLLLIILISFLSATPGCFALEALSVRPTATIPHPEIETIPSHTATMRNANLPYRSSAGNPSTATTITTTLCVNQDTSPVHKSLPLVLSLLALVPVPAKKRLHRTHTSPIPAPATYDYNTTRRIPHPSNFNSETMAGVSSIPQPQEYAFCTVFLWPNRDPMEEDGGINIYAFCLNSPTDTIDAHGLGWVKRLKSAKKAARAVEVIKDLQKRRGEITKSIRSLSDKIAEHRKKLDDYVKDPDKFDHKGFLKDAPPERRQKIIDGRKKHLEGEVSEWQKQVDNAVGEVAEIDKKISALQSVACLAGTILTPYSQQLKEWQDSGVEVTPGQILSGVTLDLLSIVDPGITDLMDWASE